MSPVSTVFSFFLLLLLSYVLGICSNLIKLITLSTMADITTILHFLFLCTIILDVRANIRLCNIQNSLFQLLSSISQYFAMYTIRLPVRDWQLFFSLQTSVRLFCFVLSFFLMPSNIYHPQYLLVSLRNICKNILLVKSISTKIINLLIYNKKKKSTTLTDKKISRSLSDSFM